MPQPTAPRFHGDINFNAQHSPAGAFLSFTCGHFGSRGGFGLQIGQPGNQNLYIGFKDGDRLADAPLRVLPFFQGALSNEAARYDVEHAAGPAEQNVAPNVVPYTAEKMERHYGWASDSWTTPDFRFSIHTPFLPLPEPEHSGANDIALLPAVLAELTVDNTAGTGEKTAFFAINFPAAGARLLPPAHGTLGFAWRRELGVRGVVTEGEVQAFSFMRWSPDDGLMQPVSHGLGNTPGIGITVPAGGRATLRLALGAYLEGVVTTGIEGRYLYTHLYGGLESVLDTALARADELLARSRALDAELAASALSPDQQFLVAHATRSYYGSTQLLEVGGRPFWVVNEGEYCMMNTLDLAVDQMFWELKHNPWVVRNLLDSFKRHYSYVDQVKVLRPDAGAKLEVRYARNDEYRVGEARKLGEPLPLDAFELRPGGISFSHDMGAHNNFSPEGNSSYELSDLNGCFSFMTTEQLCNWSLMAATYVLGTGDTGWAGQNLHVLTACLDSLVNRGGEPGFVQWDSDRCRTGSEITTYDSLDHSLAQTRNNVYIAVKCWASYCGLAEVLERLGHPGAAQARERMARVEAELARHAGPDGVIPAVFERGNPGYASRILPAAEGLVYPLVWGVEIPAGLRETLRRHTLALLADPEERNFFADAGVKLSSTSNNSWMSKIAIFMHVARRVFGVDTNESVRERFARADAAHTRWQTEGTSAYWACSDQIVSGEARGSRYYPRIITSALWME